jgi:hypothetical protein
VGRVNRRARWVSRLHGPEEERANSSRGIATQQAGRERPRGGFAHHHLKDLEQDDHCDMFAAGRGLIEQLAEEVYMEAK